MSEVRSTFEHVTRFGTRAFCTLGLIFLLVPIIVVIPLSFNEERFFSYPMPGVSLRWYAGLLTSEAWRNALANSLIVAASTTVAAVAIGGVAALGLQRLKGRSKAALTAVLISPMMIPGVVTALALYLSFSPTGISGTYFGIVLAHVLLGIPFVVITMTAALMGFNANLMRAAQSLGASQWTCIRRILLPIMLPAVISSALFVFVTSFDEFIVTLFLASPEQRTLPLQMWTGVHDDVTPAIFAAATLFILVSFLMLICVEALRRHGRYLSGLDK
ncbi:ABC transporter permease [Ensifer sp. 4252]|uniref:ABC transporter permease n=1 Tax=Ensifer sp. 4252 TaxID=3373915 RepID=UPI003D1A16EA